MLFSDAAIRLVLSMSCSTDGNNVHVGDTAVSVSGPRGSSRSVKLAVHSGIVSVDITFG
jgi:hypothetical protein